MQKVNGVFRDVNLWDLRKVNKKKPECVDTMPHAKSVDAAHFSPVNGHRILTTCYDNTLSIYDSSNMANIPKLRTIRYFQFYLVFNIVHVLLALPRCKFQILV